MTKLEHVRLEYDDVMLQIKDHFFISNIFFKVIVKYENEQISASRITVRQRRDGSAVAGSIQWLTPCCAALLTSALILPANAGKGTKAYGQRRCSKCPQPYSIIKTVFTGDTTVAVLPAVAGRLQLDPVENILLEESFTMRAEELEATISRIAGDWLIREGERRVRTRIERALRELNGPLIGVAR